MKTRITPTIGRIVLYVLSSSDVASIKQQRIVKGPGYDEHKAREHPEQFPQGPGNEPYEGEILPATVVKTWGDTPESAVQLQVMLDGPDTFWATSRVNDDEGKAPGTWHWMPYQIGQAAKGHALSGAGSVVAGWTPEEKDPDPDAPDPLEAAAVVKRAEENKKAKAHSVPKHKPKAKTK